MTSIEHYRDLKNPFAHSCAETKRLWSHCSLSAAAECDPTAQLLRPVAMSPKCMATAAKQKLDMRRLKWSPWMNNCFSGKQHQNLVLPSNPPPVGPPILIPSSYLCGNLSKTFLYMFCFGQKHVQLFLSAALLEICVPFSRNKFGPWVSFTLKHQHPNALLYMRDSSGNLVNLGHCKNVTACMWSVNPSTYWPHTWHVYC